MYKVIGIKEGTYTPKDSDKVVNYTHLHCTTQIDSVQGTAVEVVKFPAKLKDKIPPLGSSFKAFYNKFGQIEDIQEIKQ